MQEYFKDFTTTELHDLLQEVSLDYKSQERLESIGSMFEYHSRFLNLIEIIKAELQRRNNEH